MIIDRGETQPRSNSDRPIIYSSGTLTLCGSPPASPDPFRSPLRQGLQQSSQPPAASTPTPTPVLLCPCKHTHAQTPLSPGKSPCVEKDPITPLENMHLAKIKELEARIEELTDAADTATTPAEKNAALETEWRSKALEAEAKLAQVTAIEIEEANSQRSKLIEELKSETALWRRKFGELLEEHSALQCRLESATAQVSLLDRAVSTVRGDTADAVAALTAAEALINKKTEEYRAAEKEKEALTAEVQAQAATAARVISDKDEQIEGLHFQNQKLSEEIDLLNRQVRSLNATVEVFEQEGRMKKATALQITPPVVEESSGNDSTILGDKQQLFKERDININSSNGSNYRTENINKEKTTVPSAVSAPSTEHKEVLSPAANTQIPVSPPTQPLPLQRHGPPASHFDAAKASIARTAELEDSLMAFNIERSALETEIAKFPNGTAGRTVAARKRKKEIKERVEILNKKISSVRLELRKLGIR